MIGFLLVAMVIALAVYAAAAHDDLAFSLGRHLDGSGDWLLTEETRLNHMAVLGRTGRGKSKFLNLYMRMLTATRQGFCLIDPHGDLAEDVLAYVGKKRQEGNDNLWRRVHYLEPSVEIVFGYDPFWFEPPKEIHRDFWDHARKAWVHARVDRVIEILQRKQGQANLEGMPRLQRVLTDVLTAVATAVDAAGNHLSFADAIVLLDIYHPRHYDVFNRVAPFLDSEILADFERWHRIKNPEAFLREAESTINRLRSFLSPIVKAIFSRTGKQGTIDFQKIVRNGEILLVNLRETQFFSSDQKSGLGGMFVHDILQSLALVPRAERKLFTLIVDEAGEFVGKDMEVALGATRKYGLSCVFCGQSRSKFRKGKDLDMYPDLLGMAGCVVAFQTQWYEDLEALAYTLGYGDLDFTMLMNEVERHADPLFLEVDEWTESVSAQEKRETSVGKSRTRTLTEATTESTSDQQNWSSGTSRQHGSGSGTGGSESMNRHGELTSRGKSLSSSRSSSEGSSAVSGGGTGRSRGSSSGTSDAAGESESQSVGEARGQSLSVSHKLIQIQQVITKFVETGQLKMAVADQFEQFKQKIHGLKKREAVVKLPDERHSITIEVHEVKEPFLSAEAQAREVDHLKRLLRQERDYFFVADLSREGQDQRLSAFAGAPMAEKPVVEGNPEKNEHANGQPPKSRFED